MGKELVIVAVLLINAGLFIFIIKQQRIQRTKANNRERFFGKAFHMMSTEPLTPVDKVPPPPPPPVQNKNCCHRNCHS